MPRFVALLVPLLALAACAGPPPARARESTVVVFAAASLADAFEELGTAFAREREGSRVTFNFAGSQRLAGQLTQGAPADVFASASQSQMAVVADAGLVAGTPDLLATGVLEIAVEPGNPLGISGLEDLADPAVTLVLAAEEVPAGAYTRQMLDAANVAVGPASLEVDVRSVLSRVTLGEADAGVVYRSDVVAADGAVTGVEIPEGQNVRVTYPIAALNAAPNPEGAAAFVEFALSAEGQRVLAEHGFEAPG